MRPDEKLYEEINLTEENATKTRHPRIWIGDSQVPSLPAVRSQLDALVALVPTATPEAIRSELASLVPASDGAHGEREAGRPRHV